MAAEHLVSAYHTTEKKTSHLDTTRTWKGAEPADIQGKFSTKQCTLNTKSYIFFAYILHSLTANFNINSRFKIHNLHDLIIYILCDNMFHCAHDVCYEQLCILQN